MGRILPAGLVTMLAVGCAAPTAERSLNAEPERTFVGQHDERPTPILAPANSAPPTSCPVKLGNGDGADLAELLVFSRTLFYVLHYYPVDVTFRSRELLTAALLAVGAADHDVVVERDPETPPRWMIVTVDRARCTLNIERVNAPWSLLASMEEGMRFIGSRLVLPAEGTGRRFTRIEVAATNGMLSTLDPHSLLMDADAYREVGERLRGPEAAAAPPSGGEAAQAPETAATPASGDGVAYFPLRRFQRGAGAAAEAVTNGPDGKAPKGIILDLRDNPGGLVDEVARVGDAFIRAGVLGWLVSKQERTGLEAHQDDRDFDGALVVLVNHQTAEGAELVASAIKSLGRGVVLGEPTAGAGSVRAFFDVPNSWRRAPQPAPRPDGYPTVEQPKEILGLLLRTGYLRTTQDEEIEGVGVRPDIQPLWPVGPPASPGADCLLQFARAVITQAPDTRRSTLLSTAKGLASMQTCRPAP